jgi:hypothetical protein
VHFFCVVEWGFYRGFCEKRRAECGFLRGKRDMFVVKTWLRADGFWGTDFLQIFGIYFWAYQMAFVAQLAKCGGSSLRSE